MNERVSFRNGKVCMNSVFVFKAVGEKYMEMYKSVNSSMNLEKTYNKVDTITLLDILRMYGMEGKLVRAVKLLIKK